MNPTPASGRVSRRLVLGLAALLGVVVACALSCPDHDGTASMSGPEALLVADARAADVLPPTPKVPDVPTPPEPSAASKSPPKDAGAAPSRGAEITIDEKGIRIEPSPSGARKRGGTVRGSIDLDDNASGVPPWVGTVAVVSVLLVFLVPLAAIALVVWYKMRRTRMLNETLVKLAEKGIPPPPEALQALGGSAAVMAAAPPAGAPGTPAYEHAKALRKSAAMSDLRKGVLAAAVGLGFVAYSIQDDGSANWIGLVLLFVGIGYIVLWYLEDPGARRGGGKDTPGGA
jgi:hypothetical protein